jgi:hypothetical protein
MAEDRLKAWETLFRRALVLIDSAAAAGIRFQTWTFGGVGSHYLWTPASQNLSPPPVHRAQRRDDVPYAFTFCPVFSPGLSLRRYDSPSMTRS